MSIALKTALLRFLRGLLAVIVAFAIQWLVDQVPGWNLPEAWVPVVMALLMAADKWRRETFSKPVPKTE